MVLVNLRDRRRTYLGSVFVSGQKSDRGGFQKKTLAYGACQPRGQTSHLPWIGVCPGTKVRLGYPMKTYAYFTHQPNCFISSHYPFYQSSIELPAFETYSVMWTETAKPNSGREAALNCVSSSHIPSAQVQNKLMSLKTQSLCKD